MKTVKMLSIGSSLAGLLMTSACQSGGNSQTSLAASDSAQPVTLKVLAGAQITDDDFKLLFSDPVKKKYPNLTLELDRPQGSDGLDQALQKMISAGGAPDLMIVPDAWFTRLKPMDILTDMTSLVKQEQLDLGRFDQTILAGSKSDKGELWGLPYAVNKTALYYNKDIFDKFGVAYPKDGMTWDDAIGLAKQLTRTDNAINYRGLDPVNGLIPGFSWSLSYANSKTMKAALNTDSWKKVLEMVRSVYSIPGNEMPSGGNGANVATSHFIKDKNVAMVANINMLPDLQEAQGLNWDMAEYPTYKDHPGFTTKVDVHEVMATKTSKHPVDAMKVIGVVTSDEVQTVSTRQTLRITPLVNTSIQNQFGLDVPAFKGKNIKALLLGKVAPSPDYTIYDNDLSKLVNPMINSYLQGKTDINTMLQQADDAVNKWIADNQSK